MDASEIETVVGARRDTKTHLGRAVSAEQRVYVLHSHECLETGTDLRECDYSIALDLGIDVEVWGGWQDQAVELSIDREVGDLLPVALPAEFRTNEGEKQ